jgi:hypothetical protein
MSISASSSLVLRTLPKYSTKRAIKGSPSDLRKFREDGLSDVGARRPEQPQDAVGCRCVAACCCFFLRGRQMLLLHADILRLS